MKSGLKKRDGAPKHINFLVIDDEKDNSEERDTLNKSDEEWKGSVLDRSDRGYMDLMEIRKRQEKLGRLKLTEIKLNDNRLVTLDGLSQIRTLVKIEARDNRLEDARLNLEHLRELDLSRNLLIEVPPLGDLPKIQVLILRGNKIKSIKNKLYPAFMTLTKVDLSMNELVLENTNSVKSIVDEFKALVKIEDIDITQNPITKDFYGIWRYIVRESGFQLKRLNKEELNPELIHQIKVQPLKEIDDVNFMEVKEAQVTESDEEEVVQMKKDVDPLSEMLEYLEAASTSPTRCVEYITSIASIATDLINMSSFEWDRIFFSDNQKKRIEINEKIEAFLENCMILIENQHAIQNTLLSTLASLTIITTNDFGKQCLVLLGEFLNPSISRQLQTIIKKKLKQIVIPLLHQKEISELPLPVLEGLGQIMHDDGLGILFSDTCPYFIAWVKEIYKLCQTPNSFQDLPTQKLYRAILELWAKASGNVEIAKEITGLGVTKYISGIFRSLIRKEPNNNEIYQLLHTLQLIQNTAVLGIEVAQEYIEPREAKISVLEDVKNSLMIWMDAYKSKNYDLRDPQDPPEAQRLKYMLFSNLIATSGAIAHYLQFDRLIAILAEFGYTVLGYGAHQKTEPLLLISICEFAYNVVSSDAGRNSRSCIEHVFNCLGRLIPLMLYMGDTHAPHLSMEKYRYLCLSVELYQKGTMLKNDPVPLEGNTNPIVHKLFIAIIKLITFIMKYANINCSIQEKCRELSGVLNENGRETILFSCLQIPNDNVKLAIAECLDQVSVKEIEYDELAYLVRLMNAYKNLGTGRTEEVLAIIFAIIAKVLRDGGNSSREFVSKYSQNAILDTYDILLRNMERNLKNEPEEQEEKVLLSLSTVYFLKTASGNQTIQAYMVDNNAVRALKKSLYLEEKYMKNYPVPIQIEATHVGRNLENLFRCMVGQEALSPDSIVSYRIIGRIADLMMGMQDTQYDILSGEEVQSHLKSKVLEDFKKKLKLEITNWEDYEEKIKEEYKRLIEKDSEKENLNQMHKLISSFDGLSRLLHFVMGPASLNPDEELKYTLTLNDQFAKKTTTFQEKIMQGKAQETNSDPASKKKQKIQLKSSLLAELQRHSLGAMQVDKKEIARLILEPPSKSTVEAAGDTVAEAKMQRMVQSSNFADLIPDFTMDDEKRVKIFIISAVLRVIYAAVTYHVDHDTKKRALQQLKNPDILLPLTERCALIGWTHCNIATKYFNIMYILLESLSDEPDESLILDVFDVTSKVIADVLKLLQRKIQNVAKVPLTPEDEKLILNITSCASVMCSRLGFMQLIKEQRMNSIIRNFEEKDRKTNEPKQHGLTGAAIRLETMVRQMAIRFLLVQLLPIHIIYTLLDIVFINMAKFAFPGRDSNMEEYHETESSNRGIAVLLGEYLANCIDFKFSILKYFCDSEVYNDKAIRQNFLQEILLQEQMSKLRLRIQEYCKDIGYSKSLSNEVFRICQYGEIIRVGERKWSKRILAFTNEALYIFTPSNARPCTVCPPEALCPEGPILEYKVPYAEIIFCADFDLSPRLGFKFYQDKKGINKVFSKITKEEVKIVLSFGGNSEKNVALTQLRLYSVEITPDNLLTAVLENQTKTKLHEHCFVSFAHLLSANDINVPREAFFGDKSIIMFTQEDLIIFSESSQYWVVDPILISQQDEDVDEESRNRLAQFDPRKKAVLNLAKEVKRKPLSSVELFYIEDNGVPVGEVQIAKENIKMIFGAELELDRFRVELFKRISKSKASMKVEVYTGKLPR